MSKLKLFFSLRSVSTSTVGCLTDILIAYSVYLSLPLESLNVIVVSLGAVVGRGLYTETVWPFHIIDLNCTGAETMILECSYNGLFDEYNCPSRNDASLRCQCMVACHEEIFLIAFSMYITCSNANHPC